MINNEILKIDVLKPVLHKIFNLSHDFGISGRNWSEAIIVPVLKTKGSDQRIPMNYRGISQLSCVKIVFGNILNIRPPNYLELHNVIVDEQKGFRKNSDLLLY